MSVRVQPAAVCLFLLPFAIGAAQPDFSGTWKFDAKASQLHVQPPESPDLRIEHKGTHFDVTRTRTSMDLQKLKPVRETTTTKMVINGTTQTDEKGRHVISKLRWEGQSLVATHELTRKDGKKATNTIRYSLADGGRTLIADEQFRGPTLKYDNHWVLRKQ